MENICVTLWCDDWLCVSVFSQIAGSSSWHARYTVLTYLQIMVFYNLFTFMSDQRAVGGVRALVIKLLEDEQLEVRAKNTKTRQHEGRRGCRQRRLVPRRAASSVFMLTAACFSATVVIQHSHSRLSPRSSLPSSPSGRCHGNPGLQLSVAMEITSRVKEGEDEEDEVESKEKWGMDRRT